MFLHFSTPDRLLLALTSGTVPAETAAAPVKAAWDDHGEDSDTQEPIDHARRRGSGRR